MSHFPSDKWFIVKVVENCKKLKFIIIIKNIFYDIYKIVKYFLFYSNGKIAIYGV